MTKYDNDNVKQIKGTVSKVKLNKTFESKNGKEFEAHLLVLDVDGDEEKFKIHVKSKAASYIPKLKEGQKITVKTGGQYNNVLAVFSDNGKSSGGYAKTNSRKEYDPTGAIQGMILKSACDLAAAIYVTDSEPNKELVVDDIVKSAKLILLAKDKIDKLVVQALKPQDDDSDEDNDEDEKPKSSKSKPKDEDESDDEDNSPY
jgi:hypothetical protein